MNYYIAASAPDILTNQFFCPEREILLFPDNQHNDKFTQGSFFLIADYKMGLGTMSVSGLSCRH